MIVEFISLSVSSMISSNCCPIRGSELRIQIENQNDRKREWKNRMKNKKILKSYDDIYLKNICTETIRVAIHYKDLEDKWVTHGWWEVDPYESIRTSAYSRGRKIYFYAYSIESGKEWDGDSRELSIRKHIVSESFVRLQGFDLYGSNKRTVNFFGLETGENWKVITKTFSCN